MPHKLSIDWQKVQGLVPVIVQDHQTLQVLMLGYMNQEAFYQTVETGKVTFYSRTKQRLWVKGETSGNFLNVVDIQLDCDSDTLLVMALPIGFTCHLERQSCFEKAPTSFLMELDRLILQRQQERPENSYTTRLFDSGIRRIAQKVGEEGVETALAAVVQEDDALLGESADLLYHLLVLLRERNLSLDDVIKVLKERH